VRHERHWQSVTPVTLALLPASLLFRAVVASRRAAYRYGLLRAKQLPVPVIVVGNITVGGTGKTPLVIWLAQFLARHGETPGIVSRGYAATARPAREVTADSEPARNGDEPVLLARRSGAPVWVGRDRVAAARALLDANPECTVVISDDGMQHYRLERTIEIAVIDAERGLGNGWLLPAGPLREPTSRLETVNAVVINGEPSMLAPPNSYVMKLDGREFRNLMNPDHVVDARYFQRKHVTAIAGIGNPERFFAHLRRLGLAFEAQAYPDHHAYTAQDLADRNADAIVMTEKDAVKCAAYASEKMWVLPVDAVPDPRLGELILRKLKS
jgi:tetraacyldisaccharide 4'-kinase